MYLKSQSIGAYPSRSLSLEVIYESSHTFSAKCLFSSPVRCLSPIRTLELLRFLSMCWCTSISSCHHCKVARVAHIHARFLPITPAPFRQRNVPEAPPPILNSNAACLVGRWACLLLLTQDMRLIHMCKPSNWGHLHIRMGSVSHRS